MARHYLITDDAEMIVEIQGQGIIQVLAHTAPVDGLANYAISCTWHNLGGTPGSCFFINKGTKLSSDWLTIS